MKKTVLTILFCGVIVLGLTGCSKKEISYNELSEIQEQISNKIATTNYDNFASCGIDEEDMVVVVELVDNSKEAREWFQKNIMNSKYIRFEQSGPYTTSKFDFYLSKPEAHNDIKFNDYFRTNDRTIYLAGNILEFYIIDDNIKETLKYYISNTYQTFDDGIKSITDKLNKKDTLKDGGTTIYNSKEKDITMIVCNTIENNKDIFIGDYEMEFESSMCK